MGTTFEERMGNLSQKITSQRHLKTIKEAFVMTVPLTLVGSISLLIGLPPIPATVKNETLLAVKAWCNSNVGLLLPYQMTIGLFGLWATLAIAYCHAKNMKTNILLSCLIACTGYLCVAARPVEGVMSMAGLGSVSLFAGMLIAIFSVEMYHFLLKHNIKIKMPASVPPNVSAPLEGMIACGLVIVAVVAIIEILIIISGNDLVRLTTAIFSPLVATSDTLLAVILVCFLARLLWFFGIHGTSIVMGILSPILMSNLIANQAAYAAGEPLPYIFSNAVIVTWGLSLFPLAIGMVFFCKSSQLKTLGKIGIIPSFLGIGEPIQFGTPLILNFDLLIPNLFHFMFNGAVPYLCMKYGLLNKPIMDSTLGMPTIINVCLTSMDIRAALIWVIVIAVDTVVYLPFLKKYDKRLIAEEAAFSEA